MRTHIFLVWIFLTIPGERVFTSWQSTLPSWSDSRNSEPDGTSTPVISAMNARASASSAGSYCAASFFLSVSSRPSGVAARRSGSYRVSSLAQRQQQGAAGRSSSSRAQQQQQQQQRHTAQPARSHL